MSGSFCRIRFLYWRSFRAALSLQVVVICVLVSKHGDAINKSTWATRAIRLEIGYNIIDDIYRIVGIIRTNIDIKNLHVNQIASTAPFRRMSLLFSETTWNIILATLHNGNAVWRASFGSACNEIRRFCHFCIASHFFFRRINMILDVRHSCC